MCFIPVLLQPRWKAFYLAARPLLFLKCIRVGPVWIPPRRSLSILWTTLLKNPLPAPFLLNVNIPNTTIDQLSGLVVTRLGRRHAAQSVIEQVNPRGETIYWLGAAGDARDSTQGTDFWATSHNYVSMTPLQVDMTNYGMLDTVRAWCNSFQS